MDRSIQKMRPLLMVNVGVTKTQMPKSTREDKLHDVCCAQGGRVSNLVWGVFIINGQVPLRSGP